MHATNIDKSPPRESRPNPLEIHKMWPGDYSASRAFKQTGAELKRLDLRYKKSSARRRSPFTWALNAHDKY